MKAKVIAAGAVLTVLLGGMKFRSICKEKTVDNVKPAIIVEEPETQTLKVDSNTFQYRAYESPSYMVQVQPIPNFDCGGLGIHNIILVSVYQKESQQFYHMHYIVNADYEYTYNEYKTNPDLKAKKIPNLGVTNHAIDQFASRVAIEVLDMGKNGSGRYKNTGNSHTAFSVTEYDSKYLGESLGR